MDRAVSRPQAVGRPSPGGSPAAVPEARVDPASWRRRVAGWVPLLIPGIVLLLADGYRLGRLTLWRDEAATVDGASRPLPRILAMAGHIDAVNSTYYVFMHPWIAVAGISETALRLPSVLAMAVAAVFTAAIGRRLARAGQLPAPALTGVLAGLLFVAAPEVTWYAQEARAYGLGTMCATIATYLLLPALADSRWRWWLCYGAAIVAAGLFNLLALPLLAAHGVTVGIAQARQRAGRAPAAPASPSPVSRWLTTAGAAVVVLSPLIVTGLGQRQEQVGWATRPGLHSVSSLAVWFAGSRPLELLMGVLVIIGVTATMVTRPRAPLDMVTVALPWLVLPPALLLVAAQIRPVYDTRYVVYCLPALALLAAAGLAGVTRFVMRITGQKAGGAVVWLPAALIAVLLAALVAGPQRSVRLASARPDNLRMAAAVVAAHGRRGDAVLYLPSIWRVYSMAYPAPYRRLRDVALAAPPAAAANLYGTEVRAAALRARFTTVTRVWVLTWRGMQAFRHPRGLEKTEVALLQRFRPIQRWSLGESVLSLYSRELPATPPGALRLSTR
jgi:mannosyltransferase